MKDEIIAKLRPLLTTGITTEAETVYLMTETRKLLELDGVKKTYQYLTFHCDWVVHSKLEGPTAQKMLGYFDAANIHLKNGLKLNQLPKDLQRHIQNISQMEAFESELATVLASYGLPAIDAARHDGWIHFHHLYTKVIENCPLVISTKNATSSIEKVTVRFELAKEPVEDEMLFKVRWIVQDKNGQSGEIFVINSFSLKTQSLAFDVEDV